MMIPSHSNVTLVLPPPPPPPPPSTENDDDDSQWTPPLFVLDDTDTAIASRTTTTTAAAAADTRTDPHPNSNTPHHHGLLSTSSSSSNDASVLFFADATLDLQMAHDIADTPEAKQHHHRTLPHCHNINSNNNSNNNNPTLTTTASTNILQALPHLPFPMSSITSTTTTDTLSRNSSTTNRMEKDTDGTSHKNADVDDDDMNSNHHHHHPYHSENPPERNDSIIQIEDNRHAVPYDNDDLNPIATTSITSTTTHHNPNRNACSMTTTTTTTTTTTNLRIVPPKYPRDIGLVVLFLLVVPISLCYPILFISSKNNNTSTSSTSTNVLAHHPLSFATIHAITWTILVCIVLIRFLYRNHSATTTGHANQYSSTSSTTTTTFASMNIAVLLTAIAPVSIFIYVVLTLTVLYICIYTTNVANHFWIILLPLFVLVREIYIYRHYLTRHTEQINDMGYISRTTFFHELYQMSISDILLCQSKLQYRRIVRIVSMILMLQCFIIMIWRTSLLHVLNNNNNKSGSHHHLTSQIHVLYILFIGIWCTSCITKCITYLVSGAILLWSMEQSERLQQLQLQQQSSNNTNHGNDIPSKGGMVTTPPTTTTTSNSTGSMDENEDDGSSILSRQSIPEAYRTVDASVYQSVSFQMDDLHLDDDDDFDNDIEMNQRRVDQNQPYMYLNSTERNKSSSRSRIISNGYITTSTTNHATSNATITMKSMIRMGIRMNLGSIIYCGLVSPISQWIHTNIQYIDFIRQQQQQGSNSSRRTGGFQGMMIGQNAAGDSGTISYRIAMILSIIRHWVQYHNDLPMTHVATYYKSYLRATRDVTLIVQESGTF